ncbi:MAG: amidohydrolase [Acidimicrobiales bacterium]|nr:amidohydrolase [Acidimicrobiales bacterium]
MSTTDRYTVISADCHAGGNHAQYREYLAAEYLDEFDEWRGRYKNPFRDLQDDGRSRNWDDERRLGDLHDDGVVAEVVFPNTVPPFFPTGVVVAPAPSPETFRKRLEGIRAHNRWLADFVGRYPNQRVGLAQILLNDVDEAIADVRWCHDHGIKGVLLPGASPDTPWIEPLSSAAYDPLWAVCQELDMPVTHHAGGSGIPEFEDTPFRNLIFMMESSFYANRAFWHMIWGGVFERFPNLKLVLTEQGTDWLRPTLTRMEHFFKLMKTGRVGELGIPQEAVPSMSPTERFQTNVWIGSSFPAPSDAETMRAYGVDRFMWGSDYPHNEACWPYSKLSLRRTFPGWDEADLHKVLATNAAEVYGFDLDSLAPLAAAHGPTVAEVAEPLTEIPADAMSPAFQRN